MLFKFYLCVATEINTTLEHFAVENAENIKILEQFKTLTMTFVAKHLTYYKHQQFTPDCQIWRGMFANNGNEEGRAESDFKHRHHISTHADKSIHQ